MVFYTRSELREEHSRRAIDGLVRSGRLVPAGRWLATPDEPDALLLPLRQGWRATCVTAARHHHGLWTPSTSRIHVYRPRTSAVSHGWVAHGWESSWLDDDPVASLDVLLKHAATCLPAVEVGILADSALHQKKLQEADIATVARDAPRPVRRILARVDRRAASGTETRVRLFFALRGVAVEPQFHIDGVGHVDLLVGRSWVIECDSREHHDSKDGYTQDRGRDKRAHELGYVTSRLTYDDVEVSWATTAAQLTAILRTGEHLRAPEERARQRRYR